jgi:GT2 family glycosyltransferase
VWNSLCNALCLNLIFKRNPHFSGMFIPDFDPEKSSPVEVLNGWFLVVRRTALEETGLLDERFFIYGEDIDWSYRFYQAGWPRIYFAGASAVHYGGSSSARAPMRFYVEMYKANFQYWEKHHGWPGVLGYWGTSLLHQVLRFTGYSFVYLLWRGKQIEASFKVRRSATCIGWLVGARSIVKIA